MGKNLLSMGSKCVCCGKCCIICTDAYLKQWEIEKYKHRKSHVRGKGNKRILARKRKFLPEAKKHVFMCYYFDLKKRLCSIHDNKPAICKVYRHDWKADIINEQWSNLCQGENKPGCLFG